MKDNNRCDKFSCINKYISQAIRFLLGLVSRGEMFSYIGTAVPARVVFATALVVRKTELISNRKFDKYL